MAGTAEKVIRIDRDTGTLRPPVRTAQGFLRVDGWAARPGIYKYVNTQQDEKDGLGRRGMVRYELRPEEEVFRQDSLDGYEGASLTVMHPKKMLDASNALEHEVGSVTTAARRDGDRVAVSMMIKETKAIDRVDRRELNELSPGYKVRLERKSGFEPRYATKDNPKGRFDVIQRDIEVNHLALVDRARGGEDLCVRMDGVDDGAVGRLDWNYLSVADGSHLGGGPGIHAPPPKVTTVEKGHQHTVHCASMSGRTSYELAEGDEDGHDHAYVKLADGSYIITENSGHSHSLLLEQRVDFDPDQPRAEDGKFGEGGGGAGKAATAAHDSHMKLVASLKGDKSLSAEKQIHESHLARLGADKNAHIAAGDRAAAKNVGYAVEDAHSEHARNVSKIANASGSAEDHAYAAAAHAKARDVSPKGGGRFKGHDQWSKEHAAKAGSATPSDANAKDDAAARARGFKDRHEEAKSKAYTEQTNREHEARAQRLGFRDSKHEMEAKRNGIAEQIMKAHAEKSAAPKTGGPKLRSATEEKDLEALARREEAAMGAKMRAGTRAEEAAHSLKQIKAESAKRGPAPTVPSTISLVNANKMHKSAKPARKDELDGSQQFAGGAHARAGGATTTSVTGERFDAASLRPGAKTMDPEEQIRSLKAQLAESEKEASTAKNGLTEQTARADRAEATVKTHEDTISELNTKLVAGATALETEAIREQAERADAAEAAVREFDSRFDSAVNERTAIIRRSLTVMGPEFNPDRMSNREIQAIVVKRLDSAADISSKQTDAYIAGRFDSLVDTHNKTARSLSRAGAVITSGTRSDSTVASRVDARDERTNKWRNQWREPLPNSREARDKKGA